jgi:group I intron endonuclease
MIGIYKITNPSNRVYIGQSTNIKVRFMTYKSLKSTKYQRVLYRSFLKYGIDNHKFEIIEECDIKNLNKRERYWQDHYNVLNGGLNCQLVEDDDNVKILSNETKSQIRDTLKEGYKSGRIINPRLGKGRLLNLYDYMGNIILPLIDMNNIIDYLKISNRSVINNNLRDNRYICLKKYLIIPENKSFEDYRNSIYNNRGYGIPIYQIDINGNIQRSTCSSKTRVISKILNSEDFMYYSKRNNSYYTFLGLVNKCPFIQ